MANVYLNVVEIEFELELNQLINDRQLPPKSISLKQPNKPEVSTCKKYSCLCSYIFIFKQPNMQNILIVIQM